jgi:biopolymer transport protein ExbB/TolQ
MDHPLEHIENKDGIVTEFLTRFHNGNAFDMFLMWALVLMFFGAAGIVVERIYMIFFVYTANAAALMQKVQRLILDNNIEEAVKVCNTRPNSVIYQVFKAALVNANRPFDEVQDHVEVAKLSAIPKLQKRMSYLFTLGNVATLLGLLGTVYGLVVSFAGAKSLEASQKQIHLTEGISTALTATFFGLLVAIPCMFFYGFLFNRVNMLVDEIEHYSARLLMLLRTGAEYFDQFNPERGVSTHQTPRKNLPGKGSNSDAA